MVGKLVVRVVRGMRGGLGELELGELLLGLRDGGMEGGVWSRVGSLRVIYCVSYIAPMR